MIMLKYPSRGIRRGYLTSRVHEMSCGCMFFVHRQLILWQTFLHSPTVGGDVCRMGQEKIMAACYGTITSNKTNKEVSLIMRRDERTSPEEALKSACSYDLPKGSVVELQYCDLYTAHVQVGSDLKRELAKHGARMEKIRGMKLRSSARRLRDQMGLPAPR